MTDQRMQQDTLCYQWFKHTQATHVPQTTSKAVAAIFRGMPSWSSGAGTLFAACDKAFSNLGDIFGFVSNVISRPFDSENFNL